jgi:phosphoribosylglycinamide formyltransferase-1
MNKDKIISCFAGTRLEALLALRHYTDVQTIITVRDSWVHRHCQSNSIDCQVIDRKQRKHAFESLGNTTAALVLSAGFPFILPPEVLDSGPLFVNSHPSLLPAYKGLNAIREAFDNQEAHMGVTVHHMVAEVDCGTTIHQEQVWVEGLDLQAVYDLLFGVVEPMAVTRSITTLCRDGRFDSQASGQTT